MTVDGPLLALHPSPRPAAPYFCRVPKIAGLPFSAPAADQHTGDLALSPNRPAHWDRLGFRQGSIPQRRIFKGAPSVQNTSLRRHQQSILSRATIPPSPFYPPAGLNSARTVSAPPSHFHHGVCIILLQALPVRAVEQNLTLSTRPTQSFLISVLARVFCLLTRDSLINPTPSLWPPLIRPQCLPPYPSRTSTPSRRPTAATVPATSFLQMTTSVVFRPQAGL